ncbi:hypothetical protein [Xanthomonas axonopodis]
MAEDIDVGELEQYWQKIIKRALKNGKSLPRPIAALQRRAATGAVFVTP